MGLDESHRRRRAAWLVALALVAAGLWFARPHRAPSLPRREFDPAAEAFVQRVFDETSSLHCARTPREEAVELLCWAETEVDNGGLQQYFYNSTGDSAGPTIEVLEKIGAVETALLFAAAGREFGAGGPPRSLEERRVRLAEFTSAQLYRLDELSEQFYARGDDLGVLLKQYWEADRPELSRDPLEDFLPWPAGRGP